MNRVYAAAIAVLLATPGVSNAEIPGLCNNKKFLTYVIADLDAQARGGMGLSLYSMFRSVRESVDRLSDLPSQQTPFRMAMVNMQRKMAAGMGIPAGHIHMCVATIIPGEDINLEETGKMSIAIARNPDNFKNWASAFMGPMVVLAGGDSDAFDRGFTSEFPVEMDMPAIGIHE